MPAWQFAVIDFKEKTHYIHVEQAVNTWSIFKILRFRRMFPKTLDPQEMDVMGTVLTGASQQVSFLLERRSDSKVFISPDGRSLINH